MEFTQAEIAILLDALLHLESTTDVYSNPYGEASKEFYTESFKTVFDKINKLSSEKRGALYFE
ncbi:hypothetical protein [Staphylococcus carnosus]|uniref:hypothetical protein n=1 Tax=Staphylococcus carnosus TaxID=1281 RepID=UPI000CD10916|nr:hypothetical protein [Staphylococcus carnosus]POA02239.1 hypothetical protein CD153_06550 [Staphylococcus carnosus]QRQ05792.1 hypothetical protein I6J34_03765 [Staphylococcus carnosus]UTB82216.1 hypothetical protein A2I67_02410 [Staphylococcus carnosus]SUM07669.1 Uncharacterised protein [Staphylococcus carnosus]GEP79308.1 hypothetical protein SCA05_11010 [Staphylococcus carnosus]